MWTKQVCHSHDFPSTHTSPKPFPTNSSPGSIFNSFTLNIYTYVSFHTPYHLFVRFLLTPSHHFNTYANMFSIIMLTSVFPTLTPHKHPSHTAGHHLTPTTSHKQLTTIA